MDLKKSIKQGGFTLAEIMVTIAVLGIISLAVIDQVKVANSSKRESNEQAIINNIYSRVAIELSRQQTCSSIGAGTLGNLGNKPINGNITTLYDSAGAPMLVTNQTYGMAGGLYASASKGSNTVKVESMRTYAGTTGNEVFLEINFSLLKGWLPPAFLNVVNKNSITLKLNMVPDNIAAPTTIKYCFADITTSITAAVRLSCIGNGSYFIEPSAGFPYGQCWVGEIAGENVTCPSGKYIQKIATVGGKLVPTCLGMTISCAVAGKVITGFDSSGTPICDWPFPTCSPGEVLVKSSIGKYVCSNASVGCGPNYALQGWNADGTIKCAPMYPAKTCAGGYVVGTTAGNVQCATGYVTPVTCPAGQYISGTSSTGVPTCSPYINLANITCTGGMVADGFDSNGNLHCIYPDRLLTCGGATSPSGKRFSMCPGTVMNRDGGTNSYCKIVAASCPAGWTPCSAWGVSYASTASSCLDSDSGCSYSTSYYNSVYGSSSPRRVYGTGVFQNPMSGSQRTPTCVYWTRQSGSWNKNCNPNYGWIAGAPTAINEVGCY